MASYKKTMMTPWGIASFPHLIKPDTYKNQTKFKMGVIPSPGDAAGFKVQFKKLIEDERFKFAKNSDRNGVPGVPFSDDENGFLIKASSKFKPLGFDTRNNPLPPDIDVGGGSIVRMLVQLYNYEEGISFQLLQYQLKQFVARGGTSSFDAVDDGFVADATEEPESGFVASGSALDI